MASKVLVVSDVVSEQLYRPGVHERYPDIDLIISNGDLPYDYLEFLVSSFNVPLYYVRGNHATAYEASSGTIHHHPWGCIDLHLKSVKDRSELLLAGMQGSHIYNNKEYQYTQAAMWRMAYSLVPKLLMNYFLTGRYLDVLVTHAPPWKIHDNDDAAHQGIRAIKWLIKTFRPRYHFHGHVYSFGRQEEMISQYEDTEVINTYGYRIHEISK